MPRAPAKQALGLYRERGYDLRVILHDPTSEICYAQLIDQGSTARVMADLWKVIVTKGPVLRFVLGPARSLLRHPDGHGFWILLLQSFCDGGLLNQNRPFNVLRDPEISSTADNRRKIDRAVAIPYSSPGHQEVMSLTFCGSGAAASETSCFGPAPWNGV